MGDAGRRADAAPTADRVVVVASSAGLSPPASPGTTDASVTHSRPRPRPRSPLPLPPWSPTWTPCERAAVAPASPPPPPAADAVTDGAPARRRRRARRVGRCRGGPPPAFTDVTRSSGLPTNPALKYGGPVVADLDGDGTYDLVLPNHVKTPATIVWGKAGTTTYTRGPRLLRYDEDIHGVAVGDLGGSSGGRHLLVSVGGSSLSGLPPWGLKPRPPVLLQITRRTLQNVTWRRGLGCAKMRGRAARLVDLTGNGLLDAVLFGSSVLVPWDKSPRQKVFVNGGNSFKPVVPSGLGADPSEGVFMVDVNGDGRMDAVTFSRRLGVSLGRGGGRFADATSTWLRGIPDALWTGSPRWAPVTSVAALDFNNDGRLDLVVGVNGTRGLVLLSNTGTRFVDVTNRSGLLAGAPADTVGVTVGDLNNDGWTDVVPVSHESATVPVYLNRGDGTFRRVAKTGLTNTAPRGRGDGAQVYDADGDGRLDLLLSRGDRIDQWWAVRSTYRLFRNTGGAGGGGRFLAIVVGRSPRGGSPSGARVTVTAGAGGRAARGRASSAGLATSFRRASSTRCTWAWGGCASWMWCACGGRTGRWSSSARCGPTARCGCREGG
ncbi:hypothetical protein BU14_0254s0029 [Porphyra umbilicalis]|uniref:VCBS repeat-containing protein n=1 Tax=Porphyra umbilicalis TaxID=2786 RepID=A0A1X6P2P5_PORUM|nr:hypothetical protein BU14_0254s0029 [Porphyra umbilicalis]|eukprot:OSX75149.1 hypothetical protein BU14_0254s0029 [Porphyra umbilicalis]